MTSILILSVAALGFLIGWYAREIKIYIDEERRVDRLFRHYQELAEKESQS
jgi:hypothetical protein